MKTGEASPESSVDQSYPNPTWQHYYIKIDRPVDAQTANDLQYLPVLKNSETECER
jgi:hypothetical protein